MEDVAEILALCSCCLEPGMGQPWLLCTGLAWNPGCCAQDWPGKVLLVVCIPGSLGTMTLSAMALWHAIPLSLESMTEVSWWFPIRKYLGYQSDSGFDGFYIMIMSGWLGGGSRTIGALGRTSFMP